MKRKVLLSIILVLILGMSLIIIYPSKKPKIISVKKETNSTSFISMMVENEEGKYIEKTDIKFPNDGYLFNPEKSGCENGGILSWNEGKQKVQASLITSDKCYAYFDLYTPEKYCKYSDENSFICDILRKKDNTLIYHDGKCDYEGEENCNLEAGDLNYRYAGANNDVNNYVCLDSKTTGECETDDDLYRIIGLFKNEEEKYEIKLIKNVSLGSKQWHITQDSTDGHYANEWEYSSLKQELNDEQGDFYKNLNDNIKKLIVSHEWQIRGIYSEYHPPKDLYEEEMGLEEYGVGKYLANPLTTTAKIGLMYLSDYGYAASPTYWRTLLNSKESLASSSNWLYTGLWEWTITRRTYLPDSVVTISNDGYIGGIEANNIRPVARPVFYLSTNAKLKSDKSGIGTQENPYRVS